MVTYSELFAYSLVIIGIIGLVLANALRALERRLCAWKEG